MTIVQLLEVGSMKKLFALLMLGILLMPALALGAPEGCSWEGDPVWMYTFGVYEYYYAGGPLPSMPGPENWDIYAGEVQVYTLIAANRGYGVSTCLAADSFCWSVADGAGWDIDDQYSDYLQGEQAILNAHPTAGYYFWVELDITCPCDAEIDDVDTVIVSMDYTNIAGECAECGDCTNPNGVRGSDDTLILHVVAAPPALSVAQDTLFLIDQGVELAYVTFQVCNNDPCAPPTDYYYNIVSLGHIGGAISVYDTIAVKGGECENVFGVLDASEASELEYDTLTIVAWRGETYDTCVQIVQVISPQPVPLFTTPVVTILVLALILAAAVFMRRRAVSKA
jgi:hypothetical protein